MINSSGNLRARRYTEEKLQEAVYWSEGRRIAEIERKEWCEQHFEGGEHLWGFQLYGTEIDNNEELVQSGAHAARLSERQDDRLRQHLVSLDAIDGVHHRCSTLKNEC
jgi:hypothetical protein